MNNSTLVNNTDRIYGEQDPLRKPQQSGYVDTESEWTIWPKLILLMLFTYGLIVALFCLSYRLKLVTAASSCSTLVDRPLSWKAEELSSECS